jgi:hypothetical protein
MAGKGAVLASRILNEVAALGLLVGRVERAWKAAAANNDEFYYDSVALNIHSFYSGIERILEKIAWKAHCHRGSIGTRSCWLKWRWKYRMSGRR